MNNYKKLNIFRGIFAFIIFVIFGIIIFTEKGGDIFIPKIQEKLNTYLLTNYQNIIGKTIQEEITYKDRTFTMKIIDKLNKEHYFYIIYDNGKITDTYQKDYQEGKQLLREWNIPESYKGIGNCILGYPVDKTDKVPSPRKENYVIFK